MSTTLFTPVRIGANQLQHRIAMAPLTRCRASEPGLGPSTMAAEYYTQRASPGGLVITEATNISPDALGFASTPGIWTAEQVAQWKAVTDAVHKKGGVFFLQLWHVGRVSHASFKDHPTLATRTGPFSSSDLACPGVGGTYAGDQPYEPPVPMTDAVIASTIEDYKKAAKNAMAAGFDGVEVHCAHGYLLDQFLADGVNKRDDAYGGSIANRMRFALAVVDAVCEAVGSDRVAVRLSPTTAASMKFFGATDSDPVALYSAVVSALNERHLAYLLVSEPRTTHHSDIDPASDKSFKAPLINGEVYRTLYKGVMIGAGGFTPATAKAAVAAGTYDMIAFGRWFIANPDLPERIRTGVPLTKYVRKTFYGGSDVGYTDYPTYDKMAGSKYELLDQDKIGTSLPSSATAASNVSS